MAESVFASLLHTLDHGSVAQIASSLGESEQSVSRGLESSIAATLGALIHKGDDPSTLRRILDLAPSSEEQPSWGQMATLSAPDSTWMNTGRQLLSNIFGPTEGPLTDALSAESGVGSGTAKTLLAMGASMVAAFLARKVRREDLSMGEMGAILQRESTTVHNAMPVGLSDVLWPRAMAAGTTYASPVLTQRVHTENRSAAWIGAASLAALGLAGYWIWANAHRPRINIYEFSGTANRMADEASRTSDYVDRQLPDGATVSVPARGVESQLLNAITGSRTESWIDFNTLNFDTGSPVLGPGSNRELDNIAAIMKAYPNVDLRIAGYTDTLGTPENNLRLSWGRAEAVKTELVNRGVNADRLITQGFGAAPQNDDTLTGRANNRRVSLQVIQQ
jgi:OmpA-OmpF porin, OOP family